MRWFLVLLACVFPAAVNAAVVINEVAWMGSEESANHEWIELYNDGSASVDLDGWVLSDGNNLEIELAGAVGAGQYAVLERTGEASALGKAFLIYTGALVNTGATLTLFRPDGSIEDQVAGGENWENIGGDNITKDTAQLTVSGWITGQPTPNKQNTSVAAETIVTQSVTPKQTTGASKSSNTKARSNTETVKLVLPDVDLELTIDAQIRGYVHQSIEFTAEPTGLGETIMKSLAYTWNFGDGSTSSNKTPRHFYRYPGTYVVTVHGEYGRHEQVARHEITILPVSLSITENQRGDIQINNDSPYELDISGYRVRGVETFIFPEYSIILPNQTITIPKQTLGDQTAMMVRLADARGHTVSTKTPYTFSAPTLTEEESAIIVADISPQVVPKITRIEHEDTERLTSQFGFAAVAAEPAPTTSSTSSSDRSLATNSIPTLITSTEQMAAISKTQPKTLQTHWPYVGLVSLLGLSVLGLIAVPKRNDSA